MPSLDEPLPLKHGQVLFKLIPELFIPMRVGEENPGHLNYPPDLFKKGNYLPPLI
jgi:hypothetical protein